MMKSTELKRGVTHFLAILFFLSTTINIVGCGGVSGGSSAGTPSSQSTTPGNSDVWQGVATQAFASGGPFNQVQIITIDKTTLTLTVSIPLPINPFGGLMFSSPIPEVPGASVSLSQDINGNWSINYIMPLKFLLKGIAYQNPATLPNGQALPQVPGGELPHVAGHFQKGKFSLYIYGSVKYFALFVPTPGFNPFVSLLYPLKNAGGTQILGYIATVPQIANPAGGTFDGGFFVSLAFPPELQVALDNLFN